MPLARCEEGGEAACECEVLSGIVFILCLRAQWCPGYQPPLSLSVQAVISALDKRGHDSCEVQPVDALTHPDAHTLLNQLLVARRLKLSEEEAQIVLSKANKEAKTPQYLEWVAELLLWRQQHAHAQYEKRVTLLERLPDRLHGVCEFIVQHAEQTCGEELVKRCVDPTDVW